MTYHDKIAIAKTRGGSLEDHLWYLALAIGPDDPHRGMWETAGGTPVDVVRHITELSEGLRQRRVMQSPPADSAVLGNRLHSLDILTADCAIALFDVHNWRRHEDRGRFLMGNETPEQLGYLPIAEDRIDFYINATGDVAGLDADGFLSDIGRCALELCVTGIA